MYHWFGTNIAVCDFGLRSRSHFYHGCFVSETPKFLLGGLRRNYTRKKSSKSLIFMCVCDELKRVNFPEGKISYPRGLEGKNSYPREKWVSRNHIYLDLNPPILDFDSLCSRHIKEWAAYRLY